MDWHTGLVTALASVGTLLLAGKALRRLLFLPLEWLVSRTSTKIDDTIIAEAERDVGITNTLEESNDASKRKE